EGHYVKRSIHAERVAHRNTLRLLCPDGHAPLTLSLAMTQLILHTHLVNKLLINPDRNAIRFM
ncbi:MAG: hypothetical protein AAGG00_00755, partial [Cyanobacteria bacterium P01_H01_bin.150]